MSYRSPPRFNPTCVHHALGIGAAPSGPRQGRRSGYYANTHSNTNTGKGE